jgi:hypothetical protein
MTKHLLEIIGMHEPVNFSEQGILDLPTKTDTGAYNSAIDCCYAEVKEDKDGDTVLWFTLLNPKHRLYTGKEHATKSYKVKKVRSSNGAETLRFQVKLRIELKGRSFKTLFNLSDRSKMRFPVLLGRKLLAGRFLIDVSKGRKVKKIIT